MPFSNNLPHVVLITQDTKDAPQEILRIVLRMETYKIRSQVPHKYLPAPFSRKKPEYLIRWKRSMKKETYWNVGHPLSYKLWKKHKMIIKPFLALISFHSECFFLSVD